MGINKGTKELNSKLLGYKEELGIDFRSTKLRLAPKGSIQL